jgi:hypothetical protein
MNKPKLKPEQIAQIPELRRKRWTFDKIAEYFGVGRETVRKYNPGRLENQPEEEIPVVEKKKHEKNLYVREVDLGSLVIKTKRARQRLESIEPGKVITLSMFEGRRRKTISGTVETKLPDKLLIRNERGRIEMVTFADLLTMRVVEG